MKKMFAKIVEFELSHWLPTVSRHDWIIDRAGKEVCIDFLPDKLEISLTCGQIQNLIDIKLMKIDLIEKVKFLFRCATSLTTMMESWTLVHTGNPDLKYEERLLKVMGNILKTPNK